MIKFVRHFLLAGLLPLLLIAHAHAESLITVTLLGTGSPRPSADRNGPSTLVEVGGLRLLFDMGRGNTVSLMKIGVPLGSINAHFLTHMHSDHINGLPDLYLTGWIGVPYAKRTSPFLIYGPVGTQSMMEHLFAAFSEDRRIRLADEKFPLAGIQFEAHDIQAGKVFERNGVTVNAFRVFHGELIEPAFGFKIEYGGHSVVLSGDTKYAKSVEEAATGADLLIHEVAAVSGDEEKVLTAYPVYRAVLNHHTRPEEAGRLFAKAQPKLAVYSHIVLPGNPKAGLAEATPEEIVQQTRRTYSGAVLVGADLMRFRISDAGVELVKP